MKKKLMDLWVSPVMEHPRTTVAGAASILALLSPRHSGVIAAIASAIGLMLAGDANKNG